MKGLQPQAQILHSCCGLTNQDNSSQSWALRNSAANRNSRDAKKLSATCSIKIVSHNEGEEEFTCNVS